MNKERFHNELAMRLGYERIVKNVGILISIEDSDDPWITLKVQGCGDLRFKASENEDKMHLQAMPELQEEINSILSATQQAYKQAIKPF